ncbi:hypothetical protein E3O11_03470 [Cryobacterium levicorallinum]|uniref:Novel STAND NTPase 5 domain-containing protein n=1 Tax=Cryobacterium levicorallinum TaxID=995038 RepID=A0A1I3CNK6_9MICO|nr:hypothetical protein [Cryobacterium levicorallinum]TFB87875.1 hypothetical protein E3O11_03470 [Cryobacterium levicorallinum]GEP27804.1 hypothetical protein CLE01_24020 [Cryobacterium levicorallinum]SFH76105.1 hypothetical protein SAMN05216274_11427 [Cryobacterium levicorallinum]
MSEGDNRRTDSDPLSGRNADMLPTPSLGEYEFEDFTERLLSAQRFMPPPARRVVRIERWGRRGDKQHGIDFMGTFSDGKTAAWQCKRLDALTVPDVAAAVAATSFAADEFYLTYAGEASSLARIEIAKYPKWQLLDRRGLGRIMDDLPLHVRRRVLDETWGVDVRRRFLSVPGEDSFVGIDQVHRARLDEDDMLNDRGEMAGREIEDPSLAQALDRTSDWPPIVVVSGVGGVGKSRLLSTVLMRLQDENPTVPVVWLAPGRRVDQDALSELPLTPTVIVVDDAHRDPAQLVPLLSFCKNNPEAQLVLGSRGVGIEPVRAEVMRGGYRASQIVEIPVTDLTTKEGRRLVASASSGMDLPYGLSEFLAEQAKDSPFLAVLTINLIRKGELDGPLGLDSGLRAKVMARYQEHLTGAIGGISPRVIRRLLATIAALGTVDATDEDLRRIMCQFVGLPLLEYLRLLQELVDRGVLLDRNDRLRIVPELLADQILEAESVVGHTNTGYPDEVWRTFSPLNRLGLLANLANLDWRVRLQGGPDIISNVWCSLEAEIDKSDWASLVAFLDSADSLVYSQPVRLLGLLESVRLRLHILDEIVVVTDPDAAPTLRVRLGLRDYGRHEVEERLPSLYASCAENDPELLEVVLAPIVDLARTDSRPPHQFPEHPQRVILDRLANIGAPPDRSFPERIVTWVEEAAQAVDNPSDVVTPLFALAPLLEKEGYRSSMQDKRTVSMTPYLISPEWAAPVRLHVRSVLMDQIKNHGLHRASIAIGLLKEALSEPRGLFGNRVLDESIVAWEEDDCATVNDLRQAAGDGSTSTTRRLVRNAVSWPAEHAHSLRTRYDALELVTELDQIVEDDVVQLLLGGIDFNFALESQRGKTLPPLETWSSDLNAESDEVREAHAESADQHIEVRAGRLTAQVLDALWPVGEAVDSGFNALIEALRSVREAAGHRSRTAGPLFGALGQFRPDLPGPLVTHAITYGDESLLDGSIPALLDSWMLSNEDNAVAFLKSFSEHKLSIRRAIGQGFQLYEWVNKRSDLLSVLEHGAADLDAATRQSFLASLNIVHDPRGVADMLIAAGSSPATVANVLLSGFRSGGERWPSELNAADADAVLQLADLANWQGWPVTQAVKKIAESHPRLLLDKLDLNVRSGTKIPHDGRELSEHLQENPLELAQWYVDRAKLPEAEEYSATIAMSIFRNGLRAAVGAALMEKLEQLNLEELVRVVSLLSWTSGWVSSHPALAREVLSRARAHSTAAETAMLAALTGAMTPLMWSTVNGHSDGLAKNHAELLDLSETEPDLELRGAYLTAAETTGSRVESLRRQNEAEDQED